MASKPKIKIDGIEYDFPESVTLGETRLIERYCHGHIDGDGYAVGKACGMIHIAIARARPAASFEDIQAVVDSIEAADLEKVLPQAGQSPPASASSEDAAASSDSSSEGSEDRREDTSPEPSGSQPSDTGFRSFHTISRT